MNWSKVGTACAFGLFLGACGGSGGQLASSPAIAPGPKPVPTPIEVVAFEALAAYPNSGMIESATTGLKETVTISDASKGDGKISVTIGQTTYDLDGSVNAGTPVFHSDGGSDPVNVSEISKQSEATLAVVDRTTGAEAAHSYTVLGETTPLGEIDALKASAASATYTGISEIAATLMTQQGQQHSDDARGDVTLNVDFGASVFDGTMKMSSSTTTSVSNFDITDVNATISNGKIAKGVLTGDVDVGAGDTSIFLNGANQLGMAPGSVGKLTGEFFGAKAAEVGGSFEFSGTDPEAYPGDPNVSKVIVKGGFLAQQ